MKYLLVIFLTSPAPLPSDSTREVTTAIPLVRLDSLEDCKAAAAGVFFEDAKQWVSKSRTRNPNVTPNYNALPIPRGDFECVAFEPAKR